MKDQKYLNFPVLITQDEDGMFVASSPSIPSCHSQGDTYEEAQKNIQEAIELCLEVAEEDPTYKELIDYGATNTSRIVSLTTVTIPNPQL